MSTKKCKTCHEILDIILFNKNKKGLFGVRTECKKCQSIYNSRYSKNRFKFDKEFKEKIIQKSIEWAKNNPEKRAAIAKRRNKKAFAENPNKIKARAAISQQTRKKRRPKATDLFCNCGNKACHYHHYKGYDKEFWYDVIPVCIPCHNKIH